MFRRIVTETFIANPSNKRANRLLRELQRDQWPLSGYLFVFGVPVCIFVLGLVGIMGLTNTLYYSADIAAAGSILTIVDLAVSVGAWFGAVFLYNTARYRRLHYFEKSGEVVRIPFNLRSLIEDVLREDETTQFVENAYILSVADFTELSQVAEAYNKGVVTEEVKATHITPLLSQFRQRVLIAYHDTQAEQKGRLEGHRLEPPKGEIEG